MPPTDSLEEREDLQAVRHRANTGSFGGPPCKAQVGNVGCALTSYRQRSPELVDCQSW